MVYEICCKKIMSDRVDLNSQTQFKDNSGLQAFDTWVCYICTIYRGPQALTLAIITPQHAGDIKEPFQPPHPRKQGCSSPDSFLIKFISKSGRYDGIQGPYVQQKKFHQLSLLPHDMFAHPQAGGKHDAVGPSLPTATAITALQHLSYWTAVSRGLDSDLGRQHICLWW